MKNDGLLKSSGPEFYIPWKNDSQIWVRRSYVIFRTQVSTATVIPWVREEIAALDPTVPVEFSTMNERVSKLTQRQRFNAMLVSLFAGIAVLLAALGIYGVVSFLVVQRTQEIGVRLALGATPAKVMKMVFANVAQWTVAGALLGLAGAWFCTKALESLLFEVKAHDPLLFSLSLAVLLAAAFLATWFPARRAMRVDPMVALRYE